MAVDGAHWVVKMIDGVNNWVVLDLWEYFCQGDTVVDNIAYKKVFRRELVPTMDPPPFTPASYYSLFGFMRDDVAAKKVYVRIILNDNWYSECGYDVDNLLFDFSLQPDDDIEFCTMPSFYDATLSTITSGEAFGVNTRIFTASNGFSYYEGVGSDFGLFEDMFWPVKSTNELNRTELYYYCNADPCAYTLPEVTLLTIGEVFDFEVGDQFHFRGQASGQPPNADRITITDKYFSQDNDTVFYQIEHNSYYSFLDWSSGEPVLEYTFYTSTDNMLYTNLDEPISTLDSMFLINVNVILSPDYQCNTLVNRSNISVGPEGFPADNYIKEYGKGLGVTWHFYHSGEGQITTLNDKLFYYKKGNTICGEPDVVATGGFKPESSVGIYPNPAADHITFTINKPIKGQGTGNATYHIINSAGLNCSSGIINQGDNKINIGELPTGLYLLKIVVDGAVYTGKFMKK